MRAAAEPTLSRYLAAAKVIASGTAEGGVDKQDAKCLRALAAQQLLRRQAGRMVRLHEARLSGHGGNGEVDEELLRTRLSDLASTCMSAFYSYRFDRVPYHWRTTYTDALILQSHHAMLGELDVDAAVESLDRALISAGGAGKTLGRAWIEGTLACLAALVCEETPSGTPSFSAEEPADRPLLCSGRECPRVRGWSLARFEAYINEESGGEPRPVVVSDLMDGWPALTERPWTSRAYLLSQTLGGRRLVPVEIGRSYVDAGWAQELVPFGRFLEEYIDCCGTAAGTGTPTTGGDGKRRTGYLAQHNLFEQIPSLRNDIQVPDYCWAQTPHHPTDAAQDQPPLDAPQLNAWFGPARTITPLHTDGYHNLLCQVVGTKYVRLYPPRASARMQPRGLEHGVDMSNTSRLDVGVLQGWDAEPHLDEEGEKIPSGVLRESLDGVEYWECILGPGDALYIPIGWWHYVRSLSISFSVSFWWN